MQIFWKKDFKSANFILLYKCLRIKIKIPKRRKSRQEQGAYHQILEKNPDIQVDNDYKFARFNSLPLNGYN